MNPAGIAHQSAPYGSLLLHPQYAHRGHLAGLTSVIQGFKHPASGTTARGTYGGYSSPYYSSGYGGQMGVSGGGHPAPAGYDYHATSAPYAPIGDTGGPATIAQFKTSGSSTVTALTLLSFLFFLNILQNCLKEHMDTMNPTVMVMTAGMSRTRVSKLAEMNSREQQHTVSQTLSRPVQTINRGQLVADDVTVNDDQIPLNMEGSTHNTKYTDSNQPSDPEPEYYTSYANRTMTLSDNNYQDHRLHPHRPYQRLPEYFSSASSSAASSSSLPSYPSTSNSGSNNYYPDPIDSYYKRIN